MPRGDGLKAFRDSLIDSGLIAEAGRLPLFAAAAVANALKGVQPRKGVGIASSSIGLGGALLQDPVGGLGTKNPPNFANLLNTMYSLGGDSGSTAAELWLQVAKFYSGRGDLKKIDRALATSTLKAYIASDEWPPSSPAMASSAFPELAPVWWTPDVIRHGRGTPFSWFRASWDRLCSPAWYSVLPPRRWTGWAVCILRSAIGFTFLWEANFFLELAKGIKQDNLSPAEVAHRALSPTRPLIPYQQGGVAQMDVMPSIKRLLSQGLACRKAVIEAANSLSNPPESLENLVQALRSQVHPSISTALSGGGDKGGLPNLIETVRYSLLTRGTPEAVDHHGLLRSVSRNYTHVAPGPEWIVVMSAMAAPTPSSIVRLGDVQRSLEAIGFKPRIDFLLHELERAGLCASAADGDEGIEINLGFGRV
jgi:hypothetical protein